jgi:hypothetical protein
LYHGLLNGVHNHNKRCLIVRRSQNALALVEGLVSQNYILLLQCVACNNTHLAIPLSIIPDTEPSLFLRIAGQD